MASKVRNLIEYDGLADSFPEFTEEVNPIKEMNIEEICTIPDAKPDIEQLMKVEVSIDIVDTKVVKTPVAVSLEEQNLTGWKLTIEGVLRQKIQYVANVPSQSVHAAHCDKPFSAFIILPDDYTEDCDVFVDVYIEDIYAKQLDLRRFFKNVTILLVAVIS